MGQAPQANVVYEGDMVGWVPVQAVAVESEGDGVEHPVDRPHHVLAILPGRTLADRQTPGDEVVLDVHNDNSAARLNYLK